MPERDLKKFKSKEKKQKDTENSIIDGPKDVVNAQNRLYTIVASKDTGFQGYAPAGVFLKHQAGAEKAMNAFMAMAAAAIVN